MLSAGSNKPFAGDYITHSAAQTQAIGQEIGSLLSENCVVAFCGDLGAGKTTLIKGIACGAAKIAAEAINSPTFVYLNIYEGNKTLYHFDLYRLHDVEEFLSMGFDEYLFAGGIALIEWSERITSILPQNCLYVEIIHLGADERKIIVR